MFAEDTENDLTVIGWVKLVCLRHNAKACGIELMEVRTK